MSNYEIFIFSQSQLEIPTHASVLHTSTLKFEYEHIISRRSKSWDTIHIFELNSVILTVGSLKWNRVRVEEHPIESYLQIHSCEGLIVFGRTQLHKSKYTTVMRLLLPLAGMLEMVRLSIVHFPFPQMV